MPRSYSPNAPFFTPALGYVGSSALRALTAAEHLRERDGNGGGGGRGERERWGRGEREKGEKENLLTSHLTCATLHFARLYTRVQRKCQK